MASYFPDSPDAKQKTAATSIIDALAKVYPCGYCAEHLDRELSTNRPLVESRTVLEQWLCRLHNEVNVRLGKDPFDCSKVRERWKDGPPNGACD
jgi:FAD-linked sulfhydryl oxidase